MVAASSLKRHMVQKHGFSEPQTRGVEEGGRKPVICVVSLPQVLKTVRLTVPGCPAVAHIRVSTFPFAGGGGSGWEGVAAPM